jgi:MerR family redox-sensitive transcriptional activator SoxR
VNDATLTIGQLANRAGLNVSVIRYYETRGLLPEAPRVGGQRRYDEETLARLGVIDVAKRAGFSLEDIRVLLGADEAGESAHERLQALARRKLPEVEDLVARAHRVRGWLEAVDHLRLRDPGRLRAVRTRERPSRRRPAADLRQAWRSRLARSKRPTWSFRRAAPVGRFSRADECDALGGP